jgi:hypothetical protein
VIKAEHNLPETEGRRGKKAGEGGGGGEMTQTLYAHVNKKNQIKYSRTVGQMQKRHNIYIVRTP